MRLLDAEFLPHFPYPHLYTAYLQAVIRSFQGNKQLLFFLQIRPKLVALGNGSVFTNLKTDILKSYPISKPPKEVLEEFDNIVKPLFSTILLNTRQNNHLICVRDSLLPKLMSGEIDVSQVEV